MGIFDLDEGLLYSGSTDQLKTQMIGAAALAVWTIALCTFFFKLINSINRFRVSNFYEIIGIDLLMHSSIKDLKYQNFVMDSDKLDRIKPIPKITRQSETSRQGDHKQFQKI